MIRGLTIGLIPLAVAASALAGEPRLRREGPFWVEVVQGSEQIAPASGLRVTTIGAVSAKGVSADEISYTLTKRVKAASEAEAGRLLSGVRVRTSRMGKFTFLTVQSGAGVDAKLEVLAPRKSSDIVIETRGGAVDALEFDGTVKAETGGGRVTLDQIGGDAVAKTAGGDITLGRMGASARCISGGGVIRADNIGGEAFFETAGGDIVVREVDGPIRCSTNGGGIHIEQAGNLVIADTGGGPIDVGYAKGAVTAKNSGGPIKVRSAAEARCESAGGAIRLTSISGSLKATTAMGSIIARFQSQPVAESFLSTGGGDITLWIPSNLKVTIHARNGTYGGAERIVSDFPAIMVKSVGAAVIAEGTLNGGGPLVRISGNGGTIYLRRDEK